MRVGCAARHPATQVDTPGFVAVATNAALKAVDIQDADAAGQQLVFANSYHLMLQPGPEVIAQAGGLHKFMHREGGGPIITDSGGFQIFSLAHGSVHNDVGESFSKSANQRDDAAKDGGKGGSANGGELKRAAAKKANDSGRGGIVKVGRGITSVGTASARACIEFCFIFSVRF